MNQQILIIDDDQISAESLKDLILDELSNVDVFINNFEEGLNQLSQINPDIIISDVFIGSPSLKQIGGIKVFNRIWKKHFVPVLFYSAADDEELVNKSDNHPFLEYTKRGNDDITIENVKKLLKIAKNLESLKNGLCSDLNKSIQIAMTESMGQFPKSINEIEQLIQFVTRTTITRASAHLSFRAQDNSDTYFPWEQYIYPPINNHLFVGDILKAKRKRKNNPDSYRVVLTPTCDLPKPNQKLKVKKVLVASCVSVDEFRNNQVWKDKKKKKEIKSKLESSVNQGEEGGHTLLPGYLDILPDMAISYKKLELLNVNEELTLKLFSNEGLEYERLISIDSPYREQIAWSYFQNAGRVGVPIRDLNEWLEKLSEQLKT